MERAGLGNPAPLLFERQKMPPADVQAINGYCEACDKIILSHVVMGVQVSMSRQIPIGLCDRCGVIDLDLMQFCREIIMGCDRN